MYDNYVVLESAKVGLFVESEKGLLENLGSGGKRRSKLLFINTVKLYEGKTI